MNKSRFILDAKNKYGLSFEKMWQESIMAKESYSVKRALSDEVEKKFWEGFAPKYEKRDTLFDYAPETFYKLLEIIGKGKTVAEIGCGTGKFTIPISKYSNKVIAIDFSNDMLQVLRKKLDKDSVANIHTLWSKWENAKINKVDAIFSVNAIYRMWNMKECILKMNRLSKEKVVIVWTLQRSYFHNVFVQLGKPGIGTISDYVYIQNILYDLGIDGNTEFLDVIKPIKYKNKEELYAHFKEECKGEEFDINEVEKIIRNQIEKHNEGIVFNAKLKVAYIYWKPCLI